MFRGPARSRATPNTLCQKCLQKGHYSYECKVTAQERPYKARPSRTQQLLNPSLKPKLTTEVPNELLRKKGVADELLAKKEQERGRRSSRDGSRSRRQRSRSYSSDSVSTISTNRSPSRSQSPARGSRNGKVSMPHGTSSRKRDRRSLSSRSYSSDDMKRSDRNTRRRLSSFSPERRGRRGRGESSPMSHDHPSGQGDRRRQSGGRDDTRGRRRYRSRSRDGDARGRKHERSLPSRSRSTRSSPMDISDDRAKAMATREASLSRSRSRPSRAKGGMGGSDRLTSPHDSFDRRSFARRNASRSPSPNFRRGPNALGPQDAQERPRPGREQAFHGRSHAEHARAGNVPPAPPRERSLSPYSKRVAMTRSLQNGQ